MRPSPDHRGKRPGRCRCPSAAPRVNPFAGHPSAFPRRGICSSARRAPGARTSRKIPPARAWAHSPGRAWARRVRRRQKGSWQKCGACPGNGNRSAPRVFGEKIRERLRSADVPAFGAAGYHAFRLAFGVWPAAGAVRIGTRIQKPGGRCAEPNFKRQTLNTKLQERALFAGREIRPRPAALPRLCDG